MSSATKINRKNIRFEPNDLDSAFIDLKVESIDFNPTKVGLIVDESMHGCKLIVNKFDLDNIKQVVVKVGQIDPLIADIVWSKEVQPNIHMIGLKYQN